MLALHLLAAFMVAAALVLFSVLVVAGRRMDTLEQTRTLFRLGPVGGPLVGVGLGLTLLLGIVLAIDSDDFQLWDVWVILAIVLWAAARLGRAAHRRVLHRGAGACGERGRRRRARGDRAAAGADGRALARCHGRRLPADRPRHDLQAVGMTTLASVRPDDINVALLVHVVGAMAMVGALVTAAAAALVGWRDETASLLRLSSKTLLFVALAGVHRHASWRRVDVRGGEPRRRAGPDVGGDRLHHLRPRRPAPADRAHPGRDRAPAHAIGRRYTGCSKRAALLPHSSSQSMSSRSGRWARSPPDPKGDPWTGSSSWWPFPSPTSTARRPSTPSRPASTPTTTTRSATRSASCS